ncbi:citrate synthase-like protein [Gymnopilus junonius]|uniref:Citrate synthase n=1 Tax=Gymnopilus junonius TaxID=109634 RepID=A0A9P5TM21_GYMJU|nr:citrate synthase-like protein [Gymnopilus junonius]
MEPAQELISPISIQVPASPQTLVEAVAARIPARRRLAAKLSTLHAKRVVHQMTVENVMGGMRGMPSIMWEISETHPTGVRYHGKTLDELEAALPKWPGSAQISPESLLWYLYTASIPSRAELMHFTADLMRRCQLPKEIEDFMDSLPTTLLPLTHMQMAYSALSKYSKLAAAVDNGAPKANLWTFALEDALDITSRSILVISRIHNKFYGQGNGRKPRIDMSADLAKNLAICMGRGDDFTFIELTRLAWVLHQDHGANVSAHTMRLVSSALGDPYSAISAGITAGTGALHAMAIENSLNYNKKMVASLGLHPSSAEIETYILNDIKAGAVLPGYGHAVLRVADPRLAWVRRFIKQYPVPPPVDGKTPTTSLDLIQRMHNIVPDLIRTHLPKVKNPAPNVDALSGSTMLAYGVEADFILLFMANGRGMGFLSQSVWDKVLALPIERPQSITMDKLLAKL